MNAPVLSYRLTPEAPATFADLDDVRILQPVMTDEGVEMPVGACGTVVAVYAEGRSYEVEFNEGLATISAAHLVPA